MVTGTGVGGWGLERAQSSWRVWPSLFTFYTNAIYFLVLCPRLVQRGLGSYKIPSSFLLSQLPSLTQRASKMLEDKQGILNSSLMLLSSETSLCPLCLRTELFTARGNLSAHTHTLPQAFC